MEKDTAKLAEEEVFIHINMEEDTARRSEEEVPDERGWQEGSPAAGARGWEEG